MVSRSWPLRVLLASLLAILAITQNPGTRAESCRATTLKDILDAAAISKQIYDKTFKEGDTVPGMDQGYKIKRVVTRKLKEQTLKALVARKGNTEVICFMGTKTATQLFHEFGSGFLKRWKKLWIPFSIREYMKKRGSAEVMAYFWNAIDLLGMSWKTKSGTGKKVIITGHSLGGALASCLALQMALKQKDFFFYNPGSALITFGAPRTGNIGYAALHDRLIPSYKKLRFVYNGDPAPHVPPRSILGYNFRHASREIWIEKKTTTKRRLVWKKKGWFRYPGWVTTKTTDWKYHVCADGDHKLCSRSQRFPIWPGDHDIDNYIMTLKKLQTNRQRRNQFIKNQC